MEMSKVSIIVPIYNVENYIQRCAVSLFEQTYSNLEYVFVNDCTPDNSIRVLEQVMDGYPHRLTQTKIIHHEINRGVATARNTALDNCTGEFVCQIDPDDYVELDAIELLMKRQQQSDFDIVTGQMMMHRNDGQELLLSFPKYENKEEMVIDMMQTTIMHSLANRIIRRSLFEDYSIRAKEGVNCGEDCWMMTRLAYYANSYDTIDTVVYHYDCTREYSYTAHNKKSLNKRKIKDDIATCDLIRDFFKDKESVYLDEANRVEVIYIRNMMKKAATVKDAELFHELQTRLEAFDSKYWSFINWNRGYNRALTRNMQVYRLSEFVKGLYGKMINVVKK